MTTRPLHVLFLCTHNSARSILAEAISTTSARASSRRSRRAAARALTSNPIRWACRCCSTRAFRPKACAAKAGTSLPGLDAPHTDLIITACDNAAGEVCPVWPGHPATAHWAYADPSAGDASEAQQHEAFRQTMLALHRRLSLLVSLPPEKPRTRLAAKHRPRTAASRLRACRRHRKKPSWACLNAF